MKLYWKAGDIRMNDSRPLALMMVGVIFGSLLGLALFESGISTNFIWTVALLACLTGTIGFGVGLRLKNRRPQVSRSREVVLQIGCGIAMSILWMFLYGFYGLPAFIHGELSWKSLIEPALFMLITLSFFASVISVKLMRLVGTLIAATLFAAFFTGESSSKLASQLFLGIGFCIWCFSDRKNKESSEIRPPQLDRGRRGVRGRHN